PAADLLSCAYCGSWAAMSTRCNELVPVPVPPPDDALQLALARIDREWEKEKAPYLTIHRSGLRSVAVPQHVLLAGLGVVGFLSLWEGGVIFGAVNQALYEQEPAPLEWWVVIPIFALFGAVMLVGAVGGFVAGFQQALQYRAAHRRYLERRRALSPLPRQQVP